MVESEYVLRTQVVTCALRARALLTRIVRRQECSASRWIGGTIICFLATHLLVPESASAAGGLPEISYLTTGTSGPFPEALLVSGGRWGVQRGLVHGSVLIRHEAGAVLYGAGLGRQLERQLASTPWWMQWFHDYANVNPAIDQLHSAQFDTSSLSAIIPLSMSCMHTSGLADFPGVPIWISPAAFQAALVLPPDRLCSPPLNNPALRWIARSLAGPSFLGFPSSHNVFGDGSVVLLDFAGQPGLFVKTEGATYLFVGDTAWLVRGFALSSNRPLLTERLSGVQQDRARNLDLIQQVASLFRDHVDWIIVPAHDRAVSRSLPKFARRSQPVRVKGAATALLAAGR